MSTLLEVKDLDVYYGAIQALRSISFDVPEGSIVSLIGANGAGKTTTLQTISGLLNPRKGTIAFDGKLINRTPAHQILQLGLAQCPEGRRMFTDLTVEDNLMMGAYIRHDSTQIAKDRDAMFLRFPRLKERRTQKAGTLSGGEQQMLAIARALMSRPKLLLLDEPSMGLSPVLTQEIFRTIQEVASSGTTILLVEQNAKLALRISDIAYVLETGRIVMGGPSQTLVDDPSIQNAYLGGA